MSRQFSYWNFDFIIDGKHTLDQVKDANRIVRQKNREALFMKPMFDVEYLKGKRVLDLGCNSGYWSLVALKDGGASFSYGVDNVTERVEQANYVFEKYGIEPNRYKMENVGVYQFLEASREKFDVILCLGFFYHIDDPMRLMRLMSRSCTGLTIIYTIIHNSEEALISCRPIQETKGIEGTRTGLELVSSPKALYWMAYEADFIATRTLKGSYAKNPAMWDYMKGERVCFVLSKGPVIEDVYPTAFNPGYLTPQEDLAKFGYFPEMTGKRKVIANASSGMSS